MMDTRRDEAEPDDSMPDLPPDSAAAHFEAIGKAISDIDDPLGFFEPPEALVPAGLGATRQAPSP
jgi:hypothetical protein